MGKERIHRSKHDHAAALGLSDAIARREGVGSVELCSIATDGPPLRLLRSGAAYLDRASDGGSAASHGKGQRAYYWFWAYALLGTSAVLWAVIIGVLTRVLT